MFAIVFTLCLVSFGIGVAVGLIAAVYFMMQSKEVVQSPFRPVGIRNGAAVDARFSESLSYRAGN